MAPSAAKAAKEEQARIAALEALCHTKSGYPKSDAEWELLLAACSDQSPEKLEQIRALLRSPIRWDSLFDLGEHHGVLPLLYSALASIEGAVPSEFQLRLKQNFQINVHKAMRLSLELIRIVDHLAAKGVEVLPYKGLALAEAVYGDIALRQTGDIDLLIRARDLARVREAVRELGFTPHEKFSAAEERAYLKSGYECAFDGAAGRNLLEVQWSILPRFYAVDFDMDGVFAQAVTLPVAGREMKTPGHEDLFLILAVHAAKHVWGRLIWVCDLARIMRKPGLDWSWIAAQARKLGIVRIVRVTMLLAERMLGAEIPQAASEKLTSDYEADALASKILESIPRGEFDVESVEYFRLMMRLRERFLDRVRFATRLVFTPGPGEWDVVKLPDALFPLYRVVRVGRLVGRTVRG
jgi:hypothetical protein